MDHLLVVTAPSDPLREMSLADAPDYATAIAAGLAHGLTPPEALKSSFGKWLQDNAADVQRFGLANFYDGPDADRAFVNYSRLVQFVCVCLAQQASRADALEERLNAMQPVICAESSSR